MSTRADKALKLQKEKHHAILRELVQEVPNKTCADCLAKGPRWASWSLGVFMCIRCAGIHRNLGVHISKVKSVDLDSWSAEQIENILKWGNKRAAEYYECYLPKDFTRPQGNHAVESFIRNKYEKKLYVKKDGEPEPNPFSKLDRLKHTIDNSHKESQPQASKKRERPEKRHEQKLADQILTMAKQNETPSQFMAAYLKSNLTVASHHVKSSSMNDLMSLDTPSQHIPVVQHAASSNDLLNFGSFSDPVSFQAKQDPFDTNTQSNDLFQTGSTDPFQSNGVDENVKIEPAKSTKESILSLYSTANPNQQKMYGVPGGVYMMPQQGMMASQQGMMTSQQGIFSNQMNQLNSQMQHMVMNTNMHMQQPHVYNQYNMNQFHMVRPVSTAGAFVSQPAFSNTSQSNYSQIFNNSNMMTNQNQGMMSNQNDANVMINQQKFPQQQNNFGNFMGQNRMAGGSWQQQNSRNFDLNSASAMGVPNTGHTMNNQLWN